MLLLKKHLSKIIEAAILLTIGILVIIAGAASDGSPSARDAVSTIIGVVMVVVGALAVLLLALVGLRNKVSFAAVGASSAALIGVGISLFNRKWAFDMIELFRWILPFVLICVGALVIVDGVLVLVRAVRRKGLVLPGVLGIVGGAVALTFGCLCVGDNPVISGRTQLIVLGIIVVVLATVALLTTLATAAKEK